MRKLFMLLYSSIALFFALIFIASYATPGVFRPLIVRMTSEQVRLHAGTAEVFLIEPEAASILTRDEIDTALKEIEQYRNDPNDYVNKLVTAEVGNGSAPPAMEPQNSARGLLLELTDIKQFIQSVYRQSSGAFISEVRVFSATNAVVVLVAIGIVCIARRRASLAMILVSFLILPSIFIASYMFYTSIDDTIFRIGRYYPVLLLIIAVVIVISASLEYLVEWLQHKLLGSPVNPTVEGDA